MEWRNLHVVLTGATGGLGTALAFALAAKGAVLGLAGRDAPKLQRLQQAVAAAGGKAYVLVYDASQPDMAAQLLRQAITTMEHVDMLINNAGIMEFTAIEHQADDKIAVIIATNVTATLQLSRAFVSYFLQRQSGHLVFVGSIFGSLGFPHFATYCASKFAVHGFSQALRRELADTAVNVTYIAPRAIATPMNDDRTHAMWRESGQAVDAPEQVAARIVQGLARGRQEIFIGQPQSFFAWLNGVAPRLVNIGLRQQARLARRFLR